LLPFIITLFAYCAEKVAAAKGLAMDANIRANQGWVFMSSASLSRGKRSLISSFAILFRNIQSNGYFTWEPSLWRANWRGHYMK
jgi:hypothetical protein